MNGPIESLGRVRLQGVLLLGLVFVVGGVLGYAMALRGRPVPMWPGRPGGGGPPPWVAGAMRSGIPPVFERLGLSDEQRRQIESVVSRARPESDSILASALPRLRALSDSTRAAVERVLTAEQRDRLKSFASERRGPPWLRP